VVGHLLGCQHVAVLVGEHARYFTGCDLSLLKGEGEPGFQIPTVQLGISDGQRIVFGIVDSLFVECIRQDDCTTPVVVNKGSKAIIQGKIIFHRGILRFVAMDNSIPLPVVTAWF